MFHGKRIENRPAADGYLRRVSTDDKSIAGHPNYRRFKAKLYEPVPAGTYLAIGFEHTHTRENFRCAHMNPHPLTGTQRAWRTFQQLH